MILVSALETQCSQCTFVPLPCSMVAMFSCRYSLGYESILRANYRNPLCSDEHSQSTDLEHVEADSDPLSSEVCGLFKSGHAAVTDSGYRFYSPHFSNAQHFPNLSIGLKIRPAWRRVPISICMPVTTKRKKTDKVHTIRILHISQLLASAELGKP